MEDFFRKNTIQKKRFPFLQDNSRNDPGQREKINLNFYFHISLWCFKRFYKGLQDFHKTF